jgi:RNA polymerase sigma factor (TIGR02999 family)
MSDGTSEPDVTQLLLAWSSSEGDSGDQLMMVVYEELRRIAGYQLSRENAGHTLQATALVNEAYVRLVDQTRVQWRNRAHFFGIASRLMRRILVDYARRRRADKRGGGVAMLQYEDSLMAPSASEVDLVALDDVLTRLAEFDATGARVVELRYFGGLTIEETAEVLDVSPATVKREWASARAWLHRELSGAEEG